MSFTANFGANFNTFNSGYTGGGETPPPEYEIVEKQFGIVCTIEEATASPEKINRDMYMVAGDSDFNTVGQHAIMVAEKGDKITKIGARIHSGNNPINIGLYEHQGNEIYNLIVQFPRLVVNTGQPLHTYIEKEVDNIVLTEGVLYVLMGMMTINGLCSVVNSDLVGADCGSPNIVGFFDEVINTTQVTDINTSFIINATFERRQVVRK